MADFKPNGNFAKTFLTPGGMTGRWLKVKGKQVEMTSKTLVGVKTGRLQKSIKTGKVTKSGPMDLEVHVGSDVSHALVHHEGSRPHVITPHTGSALHWGGAKGPIVAAVVHPGTKGNKYLLRAMRLNGLPAKGRP